MKKVLLSALVAATALTLYNCAGDDAETLDPANEAFDSLQPGDSVAADTFDYPGPDTIPQDSVWIPVDSIPGDSITVQPYPGDTITIVNPYPGTPGDSIYFPGDSTTGQTAHPRQKYLKKSFDLTRP